MTQLNPPTPSNDKTPVPETDPNRTELLPPPSSTPTGRKPEYKKKEQGFIIRNVSWIKNRIEEILNADIEEVSSRRLKALVYLVKVVRESIETTARDRKSVV